MSSLCAPVGVGQPAGNCPQLNGETTNAFLVRINNQFTALDTAQCPDPSSGTCPQPYTLAQLFQEANLDQADITCWLSLQPCWNPQIIEYFNALGIDPQTGLPTSTPTPIDTNFQTPQLNQTTAYVSGSQVINASTGQPINPPTVVTSTPGASPGAATSVSPSAASCSFALFGETSCIGPFGTTTALVFGAAALALIFLLGGKH